MPARRTVAAIALPAAAVALTAAAVAVAIMPSLRVQVDVQIGPGALNESVALQRRAVDP